jgi:hypothetical protein
MKLPVTSQRHRTAIRRAELMAGMITMACFAHFANAETKKPPTTRVQYPVIRGAPSFSFDGRYLGVIVEERDQNTREPCSRLRVLDATTWNAIKSAAPEVTKSAGLSWAPNEQALVCGLRHEADESLVYALFAIEMRFDLQSTLLPSTLSACRPGLTAPPKWSPCGRYVLSASGPREDPLLVRYARQDGKCKTLRVGRPFATRGFAWAEDAESVWVAAGDLSREEANPEDGILRVSFAGSEVRRLCRLPRVVGMEVSADRQWLACAARPPHATDEMPLDCVVVNTADGTIKPVGKAHSTLQWSTKGHRLAFLGAHGVQTYDPATAELKTLPTTPELAFKLFWHPTSGELWVVVNSRTIQRFDGETWVSEWTLTPDGDSTDGAQDGSRRPTDVEASDKENNWSLAPNALGLVTLLDCADTPRVQPTHEH